MSASVFRLRRFADIIFAWLFRAFSFSGVAALGAILVFIFIQGTQSFIFPDAKTLRLVFEALDRVTVNGTVYENPQGFIELPWDTEIVSIQFANGSEDDRELVFHLAPERKGLFTSFRTTLLRPIEIKKGEGEISFPDAYTCSVSFSPGNSGGIAALKQKIHIILPEPPYSVFKFLGGEEWLPTNEKVFGILPMILGTLFICFGALLLGVPVAILSALFMSEFLPEKIAGIFRSGVELLAGIPSVVYGFFGLMVIVPLIKNTFKTPQGNSLLAALIVLAIMILPTIIAVSEKSLKAVPRSMREASLAVGASKMQTAIHVVLPHARSAVIAAVILGFSRAVGETMAVILVAGNSVQFIKSPLDSVRTLTATIALEMGYAGGRHALMLFSIAVVLLLIIFLLNGFILFARRRNTEE